MDGDENISPEEFLRATAGFTKMDPKTLYEHLDTNGKQTSLSENPLFSELGFY